jgi:hypothetical protein
MLYHQYTAISTKVVHERSGKVEYERERLLGIANKLMNFQSDSQQPVALVFDFSALERLRLNKVELRPSHSTVVLSCK